MNTAMPVMGTPGVSFLMLLIIGAIAGWIAEKVTQSDHGLFTNIIVGIAGSFIASKLAEIAQVPITGFVMHLVAAALGAIVLLFVWRAVRQRR